MPLEGPAPADVEDRSSGRDGVGEEGMGSGVRKGEGLLDTGSGILVGLTGR